MKQERVQKQHRTKAKDDSLEPIVSAPVDRAEAIKDDLDDVLADIDKVLEENAEEFVAQYVQKGGE